jgi:hypothetical protein
VERRAGIIWTLVIHERAHEGNAQKHMTLRYTAAISTIKQERAALNNGAKA